MTSTVSSLSSSAIQTQVGNYETMLEKPITVLGDEVTTDKAEISAWGAIQGSISSLSSALSGISDISTLSDRQATSSTTGIATATVANSALVGSYDLTGIKLAKGQSIYSALQSSAAATLSGGSGSISFTLKNGTTENVSVSSASMTLTGIASAINAKKGGVEASVVNSAAGARLVLQSSATGSSQAFSATGTGALSRFSYSPASAGTETLSQSAKDAAFSLNGVPVTSASNSVTNVITGVTLKLVASGSTSINVSSSPTSLSGALSQVATEINTAVSTIAKETKYVGASTTSTSASASASAKSGPLLGNYSASNLSSQLLSAISGAQASGLSAAAIGLTVGSAGSISFDSTTFAAAYAENPSAVQTLVSQIQSGLSSVTKGAIGDGTSTGSGTTDAAISGLTATDTEIGTQITQMTKIDTNLVNNLLSQYAAAESETSSSSIDQAYLSIFLGGSSSSSKS